MPEEQAWSVFTVDPRYRLRERIALGVFALGVALLVWQRQEIEGRFLSWRLLSGGDELGALFRLADLGPDGMRFYVDRIDDPDPEIRYKVLLTLKAMRHEAALPYLRARMNDPDIPVRLNAFDAMAELKDRALIPTLIEALGKEGDDGGSLRRVARNSLEMITGETFDYDAQADPEERARSITRWKAWWNAQDTSEAEAKGA